MSGIDAARVVPVRRTAPFQILEEGGFSAPLAPPGIAEDPSRHGMPERKQCPAAHPTGAGAGGGWVDWRDCLTCQGLSAAPYGPGDGGLTRVLETPMVTPLTHTQARYSFRGRYAARFRHST